jgi:hypothetical protein
MTRAGDVDEEADQLGGLAELVGAGGDRRDAEAGDQAVEAEVAQGGGDDVAEDAADDDAGGDDEHADGEVGQDDPEAGHHLGERAAEGDEAELVERGDAGLEHDEGHHQQAEDGAGLAGPEQLAEADLVDEAVEAEAVEEVVDDDADDAAEDVAGEHQQGGEAERGDDADDAVEGVVEGLGDRGDAQGVERAGEAGHHDQPEHDVAGGLAKRLGGGGLLLALDVELGEAGVDAQEREGLGQQAAEQGAAEVGDHEDEHGLAGQRERLDDGVDEALDRAGGLGEAGELQHADDDQEHQHVEHDAGDEALEGVGRRGLGGLAGGRVGLHQHAEAQLLGELVVERGLAQAAVHEPRDELGDQPAAEEQQQRQEDLLADDHGVAGQVVLDRDPPVGLDRRGRRARGGGRDGGRGRGGEARGEGCRAEQQGEGASL